MREGRSEEFQDLLLEHLNDEIKSEMKIIFDRYISYLKYQMEKEYELKYNERIEKQELEWKKQQMEQKMKNEEKIKILSSIERKKLKIKPWPKAVKISDFH